MDSEPEQLDLGALGLPGICRETCRVLLRAILPSKGGRGAPILSALLLAHIAANCGFLSLLHANYVSKDDLVLGLGAVAYTIPKDDVCMVFLLLLSLICASAFVFGVDLIRRNLPREPLARLVRMFDHVNHLAISYTLFAIAACLLLLLLDTSNDVVVILPLRVIGGAAWLTGAAYASVVLHNASVVSVLEGGHRLGALRKSRALLAKKFWVAAAVFVALDGCFVALQKSLLLLALDDALGLGRSA